MAVANIPLSRLVSLLVLVAIIVFTAVLFFRVMAGFFVPLFIAAVLVIIFRPLHDWLMRKSGGRSHVAAGLTTAAILLAVVGPLVTVCILSVTEGLATVVEFREAGVLKKLETLRTRLALDSPFDAKLREAETTLDALEDAHDRGVEPQDYEAAIRILQETLQPLANELPSGNGNGHSSYVNLKESLNQLEKYGPLSVYYSVQLKQAQVDFTAFKQDLLGGPVKALLKSYANPSAEELRGFRTWAIEHARPYLFSITGEGASRLVRLVLGTLIMCVALYFFFLEGPSILNDVLQLSPLDKSYERELLNEFGNVSRAVVLSTLLSALAQAGLAFFGFYFAGLQSVFFLTFLTMVLALVPIVGASVVWVPACLYLFFVEERSVAAIGLAIYGTLVISLVDNLVKPLVLHGQAKLHPLFALLSILGGVTVLGPIGILVGPMIVAFLQALLKILRRELGTMERGAKPPSESFVEASAAAAALETALTAPPPPPVPPPAPPAAPASSAS